SGGNSPLTLTASYTDYRFRLFSNFTFFKEHPESGDEIEQTDSRSILALKAENDIIYLLGSIPMRTRFGIDLRNDDIMVGLFHDSARVRLETTSDAAIAQRQLGPYAEQEIILPWAQFLFGLRADYFSFDVENRLRQGTQPEGIAQKLLLSPKASVAVPINDDAALFLNSGFGFHSNDARDVVREQGNRTLPRALGAEVGFRYGGPNDLISGSAAAWMLNLESEFVYIGDEGSTEASGRTHREGIDLELRINPVRWLALGADATISRGRSVDDAEGKNYIPLAPNLTISGNALFHLDNFSAATRLRLVGDRPANADNSVRAKGYGIVDLSASYKLGMAELFVNVENLLNAEWNEAQFDTESRLRSEAAPVDELHFTAGTPRSIRSGVAVRF
ncbi:MAG: TonB-dependent receptor, partial [Candidatus Kapaibacterium sp.]